nr:acyl carrier protein [Segnochrobactrum spirostomi]
MPVVAEWRAAKARAASPAAAEIAGGPSSEAAALTRWLRAWLAAKLEIPEGEITPDRGLGELGLTSIDAVELSAELGQHCGRELSETFAFDYPTVRTMVDHLCGAPAPAVASLQASAPASGGDIEELLSMIEGKLP